jgi:Ca2+-binding RTX toxin-like protein
MTTTIDTNPAGLITVNDKNVADTITISDGPTKNGFLTTQVTDSTDTTIVANKTNVDVAGGSGGNQVILNSPNPADGMEVLSIFGLGTGGTVNGGSSSGSDITVDELDITAPAGIGVTRALRTQASRLMAVTNGTGNINISNGVSTPTTLTAALTAGGSIVLSNNGTLIDSGGITANQSINLTANGSTADLDVSNNGSISAKGSLVLEAGEDLNLGDGIGDNKLSGFGIFLSAGRNITIDGSSGIENDTAGDLTLVAGTPTAAGNITMLTSPGGQTGEPEIVNTVTGGTIALFAEGGGTLTIDSTGTTAILSTNGSIFLEADAMVINKGINSGGARTTLVPSTAGLPVRLGGDGPGVLGLTQAELNEITAATVEVGGAATGTITVAAPITTLAGSNVLTLVTEGNIVENPFGSLAIPDLRLSAGGSVTLNNPNNNIQAIAANTTGAVSVVDGTNILTVATVDSDQGIITTNSPITLTADALSIQQPLNAGTRIVTLTPFTATDSVELGASNGSGVLGLLDNELGLITARVVRVDSPSDISVEGPVTRHAGYNTLSLTADGVLQAAALAVANLAISSASGIALNNSGNSIDTLAFANYSGDASIVDGSSGGLTIGQVDGLASSWCAGTAQISTAGNLTFKAGLTAGVGAFLTSTGGGMVDGTNGADTDVSAQYLTMAAQSNGIGTAAHPFQTQVSHLVATSSGGGIFINNDRSAPGTLSIVDAGNGVVGVQATGASGDIVLTNNGTINSLTAGDNIVGNGNITVKALGANSDINLGGQTSLLSISGGGAGLVDIEAGRDLNLGNSAGKGAIRNQTGSIKLVAGRNLTIDPNAFVEVSSGKGGITATAGGNFTMTTTPGSSASDFITAGGAISLSAGAGATMTLASLGGDVAFSNSGNITLTADKLSIGAAVDAGTGNVLIQPVTARHLISLGSASGGLTLNNTTLNELIAHMLTIGNASAGIVRMAGTVSPANVTNLTINTGGGFTASSGAAIEIGSGVLTIRCGESGAGAIADLHNLAITAGSVDIVGGAGNDIFKFAAANLVATDTVVGGGGSDELMMTSAGTINAAGVRGVETYALASGSVNTLTLANANFTGVTGGKITVDGGSGGNTINASGVTGAHSVVMVGGAGKDTFTGGAGNDIFKFAAANLAATDTVVGGGGSDELMMTSAGTINAAGVRGVETYALASGNVNRLTLTNANFTGVTGGKITVDGGSGGNTLNVAALTGSNQVVLVGGSGNDVLTVAQHATMTGGGGADTFVLTTPGTLALPDTNTITDFVHSIDKIAFSDAGFKLSLAGATSTPKALPATLFASNSTGSFSSATQRFAYNTTTGALYYDSKGDTPGSSRQLVATLSGHPTLTASDLYFVS